MVMTYLEFSLKSCVPWDFTLCFMSGFHFFPLFLHEVILGNGNRLSWSCWRAVYSFFLMSMLKYCMLSVGNFQLKFYPSCFSLWNSVGPVASSTAFPFWWVKHTFFPAATLRELSRSDNTKSWKVCDACSKQLMGTDACRHPVVLETLTV